MHRRWEKMIWFLDEDFSSHQPDGCIAPGDLGNLGINFGLIAGIT